MPTKPSLAVLNYVIGTKECWNVSKELIDGFGNCRFSIRDENDIGHGIDFRKDVFQMPKEEGMSVTQFPLMDQISQRNAWSRIEVSVFKQEHGQIEITKVKGSVVCQLLCRRRRRRSMGQCPLERFDNAGVVQNNGKVWKGCDVVHEISIISELMQVINGIPGQAAFVALLLLHIAYLWTHVQRIESNSFNR